MCGIAGIVYRQRQQSPDPALLRRMGDILRHRGPDDEGFHCDGPAGLAFRRLSIIDIATGHQPMANEDRSAWIIFNGEIYNHLEVRRALEACGHRYATRSDTETILHAWEEYGLACLEHLRGMFCFAIWDARRRRLFAARDRLGIKPFYYCQTPEAFLFSSEIKALLASGLVPRELNPAALPEYFLLGYGGGEETMFRGIYRLPPGHLLTLEDGRLDIRPYWDLPLEAPPVEGSEEEIGEQLRAIFDEAVRLRLVSEVPLGVFLSGGVDSSAIVAAAARAHGDGLKTFSVGWSGAGDGLVDERAFAAAVARQFRTEHQEIILGQEDFWNLARANVWHLDEPVADAPSIPLLMMSRAARRHCTVLLSGEGADEVFAGYAVYGWMQRAERLRRATGLAWVDWPARLGRWFGRPGWWLTAPLPRKYWGVKARVAGPVSRGVLAEEFWRQQVHWSVPPSVQSAYQRVRGRPPLEQMLYVDTKIWLPNNLLVRADKMTMAASLELRVPFLDHKLVEFAFRLPAEWKIRNGVSKYIEKTVLARELPAEIVHRGKMGFQTPIAGWLKSGWLGRVRDLLLDPSALPQPYFDRTEISRLIEENAAGRQNHTTTLWNLIVFALWHRIFFREAAAPPAAAAV